MHGGQDDVDFPLTQRTVGNKVEGATSGSLE
jgi:hypothetical protein